jgi:hypothetical protein
MEKIMSDDHESIQAFSKAYRKWLGKWKLGVTSVNPSYGVRNTLSDFWNMYLAGVPLHSAIHYGGVAARLMRDAKNQDPQAIAKLVEVYDQGVLSGLFPGDVQQVTHMLEHAGSKRALLQNKRFLHLFSKTMQDVNRNRENWGRLTHYLYRREAQGMSIAHASMKVKEAHFDYEDLTPFEQKVMKSVAPFYTWSRKNIPFQLKQLVASPGRYSTFPKLAVESTKAAGGDQQPVPGYFENSLAFRVPGGGYTMPMIGVTDLLKADPRNIGQTFATTANPAFSVPYELALNKNLFTGRDIVDKTGHPRTPIRGGIVPSLMSLLPGSNVGTTERGGKRGPGMNPKYAFLIDQLGPIAHTLVNQGGPIKQNSPSALSMLTGFKTTQVDPKQELLYDQLAEADSFKGYLRGLRDQGVIPEAKNRKQSAHQRAIQEALRKAMTGG